MGWIEKPVECPKTGEYCCRCASSEVFLASLAQDASWEEQNTGWTRLDTPSWRGYSVYIKPTTEGTKP